jgi:hypothetical protein
MAQPQVAHLEAVKHILGYIRKTLDFGILYRQDCFHLPHGFSDADWAACPKTWRSTGGYVFILVGGATTWQSKRQMTVSKSSTESEYISLSNWT